MRDRARPFTNDERLRRIERAKTLMAEAKIDAILLAGGASPMYFANVSLGGGERLWALIIPAKGAPFVVCPVFEEDRARELFANSLFGHGVEIRAWQEDESPFARLAGGLKDRGIASGRLGIDEMVKFVFADGIAQAAPALRIVSATPVTAGCRMIKDAHEIECIRLAGEATLKVYEAVYLALREGMTQDDVAALIQTGYARVGFPAGIVPTPFGHVFLVFDPSGSVKWNAVGYDPIVALAGGGLIASSDVGNYIFDGMGNAVGQTNTLKSYSWRRNAYDRSAGALAQFTAPQFTWGTGYGSFTQGNVSNGTAVGVVNAGPIPSFDIGVRVRGANCSTPGDLKVVLSTADEVTYLAKKNQLLSSATLTSQSCLAFFADPVRAPYYPLLAAAIDRQSAFDGSKSTISRWDAGVFPASTFTSPAARNAESILRNIPMCSLFIPDVKDGVLVGYTTAASQGVLSYRGSIPVKDVYLNTDPYFFSYFGPATLLHEVLHNVTGFDDGELRKFVGPPSQLLPKENSITKKLIEVGCAPN